MRSNIGLWLFLLLAACTLPASPGAEIFARYPGLERAIREAYEAYGLERNATCTHPVMQAITRLKVVRDDASELRLRVRYTYTTELDSESSDRSICSGFAEREFLFRKEKGELILADLTGPHRTKPYFTLGTFGGAPVRIRIPVFLEPVVPLPEELPRRRTSRPD